MYFKLLLLLTFVLFSCKENKEQFNYETSIASKVYQAQLRYLDNTIFNYARISKKGDYYFQESQYLDKMAKEFQDKIKKGEVITDGERRIFHQHFEKTYTSNGLINRDILKEIKELPIKTVSDVDYLRLYIKNNFVCILLNNKLLPYDTWSTMASASQWTISDGEEFVVSLANTAWNNAQPNEWFLVKNDYDSLTKENIIDTLFQDETGTITFRTKNYKKGENVLTFISKLNTPVDDYIVLSRQIVFTVK